MIRKTLTIFSLIGLLLSVGLWGVSYFWVGFQSGQWYVAAEAGTLYASWNLGIPLWMPTLLFLAVFWLSVAPLYRRRKRKKLGLCLKCGYDLRGSTKRCPECNTPIEGT